MPALVFPAPGCTTGTQFLNPFSGFDIAPVSGGTFRNLLLFSQNLSNTAWMSSTKYQTADWYAYDQDIIAVRNRIDVGADVASTGTLVTLFSETSTVGQSVVVTSGTTYTLSFFAKQGTANVGHAVTNSAGTFISSTSSYVSSLTTSSWTRVTTTFTANTSSVIVYPVRAITSGTVRIFGAQLELGSVATPYQLTQAVSYASLGIVPNTITYNYVNKISSGIKVQSVTDTRSRSGKVSAANKLNSVTDNRSRSTRVESVNTATGVFLRDFRQFRGGIPGLTGKTILGGLTTDMAMLSDLRRTVNKLTPGIKVIPITEISRAVAILSKYKTDQIGITLPTNILAKLTPSLVYRSVNDLRRSPTRIEAVSTGSGIRLGDLRRFKGGIPGISTGTTIISGSYDSAIVSDLRRTVNKLQPSLVYRSVNDLRRTVTRVDTITTGTGTLLGDLRRFKGGIPGISTGTTITGGFYESAVVTDPRSIEQMSPFSNQGLTDGPLIKLTGQSNLFADTVGYHIYDRDYLGTFLTDYVYKLYFAIQDTPNQTFVLPFKVGQYVQVKNVPKNYSAVFLVLEATLNTITISIDGVTSESAEPATGFPNDKTGNTTIQSVDPYVYPKTTVFNNLISVQLPYEVQYPRENLFFAESFTPNLRGVKLSLDRNVAGDGIVPTATNGSLSIFQDLNIPGDNVFPVYGATANISYNIAPYLTFDRDILTYSINTQTVRTIYFPYRGIAPYSPGSQIRIRGINKFDQIYNVIDSNNQSVTVSINSTFTNYFSTTSTSVTTVTYSSTRINSATAGTTTFTNNRTDITELGSSTMTEIFNAGYPETIELDNGYYNLFPPFSLLFDGQIYENYALGTNSAIYFGQYAEANWIDDLGNIDAPYDLWSPSPLGPADLFVNGLYISSYNNKSSQIFVKTEGEPGSQTYRIRFEGYGFTSETGTPTLVWEAVFYEDPTNPGVGNGVIDIVLIADSRRGRGVTGAANGFFWLEPGDHRTPLLLGGIPTVTTATSTFTITTSTLASSFISTSTFPIISNMTIEKVFGSVYEQKYVSTLVAPTNPRETLYYANIAPGYRYNLSIVRGQIIASDNNLSYTGKIASAARLKGLPTFVVSSGDLKTTRKLADGAFILATPDTYIPKIAISFSQTSVVTTTQPVYPREILYYINIGQGTRLNRSIVYGLGNTIGMPPDDRRSSGKLASMNKLQSDISIRNSGNLQKRLFNLRTDNNLIFDVDKLSAITKLRTDNNLTFDVDLINILKIPADRTQVFYTPLVSSLPKQLFNLRTDNISAFAVNMLQKQLFNLRTDNNLAFRADKLFAVTKLINDNNFRFSGNTLQKQLFNLRTDNNLTLTFNTGAIQNPFRIPADRTQVFYTPLLSKLTAATLVRSSTDLPQVNKVSAVTKLISDNNFRFSVNMLQKQLFSLRTDNNFRFSANMLQKQLFSLRTDSNLTLTFNTGAIQNPFKIPADRTQVFFTPLLSKLTAAAVLRDSPTIISVGKTLSINTLKTDANPIFTANTLQKQLFNLRSDNASRVTVSTLQKQLFNLKSDLTYFWNTISYIERSKQSAFNNQTLFLPTNLGKLQTAATARSISSIIYSGNLSKPITAIKEPSYNLNLGKTQSMSVLRADRQNVLFNVNDLEKQLFKLRTDNNLTLTFNAGAIQNPFKIPADRTQVFFTPALDRLTSNAVLKADQKNTLFDVNNLQKQLFNLRTDNNLTFNADTLQKQLFNLRTDNSLKTSVDKLSIITTLRTDSNLTFDVDLINPFKIPADKTQVFFTPTLDKLTANAVLRADQKNTLLDVNNLQKQLLNLKTDNSLTFGVDKLSIITPLRTDNNLTFDVDLINPFKIPADKTQVFYAPTISSLPKELFNLRSDNNLTFNVNRLSVITALRTDNNLIFDVDKLSAITLLRTDNNLTLTFNAGAIQNPFRIPADRTQVFFTPLSSKLTSNTTLKSSLILLTVDKLTSAITVRQDYKFLSSLTIGAIERGKLLNANQVALYYAPLSYNLKSVSYLKSDNIRFNTDTLQKQLVTIKDAQTTLSVDKLTSAIVLTSDKILLNINTVEKQLFNLRTDNNLTLTFNAGAIQNPFRIPADRTQVFYTPELSKLTSTSVLRDTTPGLFVGKTTAITLLRTDSNLAFDSDRIEIFKTPADKTQVLYAPLLSKLTANSILRDTKIELSLGRTASTTVLRSDNVFFDIDTLQKPLVNLRTDNNLAFDSDRIEIFKTPADKTVVFYTPDIARITANTVLTADRTIRNADMLQKQLYVLKTDTTLFKVGLANRGFVLRTDDPNAFNFTQIGNFEKAKDNPNKYQVLFLPATLGKVSPGLVVRSIARNTVVNKLLAPIKVKADASQPFIAYSRVTDYYNQNDYSLITAPDSPRARLQYQKIAPGFNYSHGIQQGRVLSPTPAKINPDNLSNFDNIGVATDPFLAIIKSTDPVVSVIGRTPTYTTNVLLWYINEADVLKAVPIGSPVLTLYFEADYSIPNRFPAGSTVRIFQTIAGDYNVDVQVLSSDGGSITIENISNLPPISGGMTIRRLGVGYPVTVYFTNNLGLPRPYYPGTYVKLTNNFNGQSTTALVTDSGNNYVTVNKLTNGFYLEVSGQGTIAGASVPIFRRSDVKTTIAPTNPREMLYYAEMAQGYKYGRMLSTFGNSLAINTVDPKLSSLQKQINKVFAVNVSLITDGRIVKFQTGAGKNGQNGIVDVAAPKKEPIQFWN